MRASLSVLGDSSCSRSVLSGFGLYTVEVKNLNFDTSTLYDPKPEKMDRESDGYVTGWVVK